MQYLSYSEYNQMGGVCDSTAFNRYIDRACGIIDTATHQRTTNNIMPLKSACRAIIDYIADNELSGGAIQSRSQSAGAVSESESYKSRSVEEIRQDIDNIIYDYLGAVTDDKGTPILYRGCVL